MYIFFAFMIEICRFMSVHILAMINIMSIQLSMFVACVIMDFLIFKKYLCLFC